MSLMMRSKILWEKDMKEICNFAVIDWYEHSYLYYKCSNISFDLSNLVYWILIEQDIILFHSVISIYKFITSQT